MAQRAPFFTGLSRRLGVPHLAAGAVLAIGSWMLVADAPPVQAPAVWHRSPDAAGHATAYVDAAALAGLRAGMPARFYSATGSQAYIPLHLVDVDSVATRRLSDLDLSSPYGGPLAASWDTSGALRLDRPIYRVLLAGPAHAPTPDRALGRVLFTDGPALQDAAGRPLSMR